MIETTKADNAYDSSIFDLTGMGDEAFLLSNDSYNHFIMVRKGTIIMRLQMKNASGKKSLDDLKTFAEKVPKQL
jgi:hypothetical protein